MSDSQSILIFNSLGVLHPSLTTLCMAALPPQLEKELCCRQNLSAETVTIKQLFQNQVGEIELRRDVQDVGQFLSLCNKSHRALTPPPASKRSEGR